MHMHDGSTEDTCLTMFLLSLSTPWNKQLLPGSCPHLKKNRKTNLGHVLGFIIRPKPLAAEQAVNV